MFKVFHFEKKGSAGGSMSIREFDDGMSAEALLFDIKNVYHDFRKIKILTEQIFNKNNYYARFDDVDRLITFKNGDWLMKSRVAN